MKWLFVVPLLLSLASVSAAPVKKKKAHRAPAPAPSSALVNGKFSTVIIDAGHGGHDRGGVPGQRASEKDLALDVARRLRALLEQKGVKTIMTRSDDTFVSLPGRVAVANARNGALFLSIHFNSAVRRGADGMETYYYRPQAAKTAARIQTELMRVSPGENRGVKRRAYYVLRKTNGAAVLAECGFLTNPSESALCLKPAHRQNLAQALANGIETSL